MSLLSLLNNLMHPCWIKVFISFKNIEKNHNHSRLLTIMCLCCELHFSAWLEFMFICCIEYVPHHMNTAVNMNSLIFRSQSHTNTHPLFWFSDLLPLHPSVILLHSSAAPVFSLLWVFSLLSIFTDWNWISSVTRVWNRPLKLSGFISFSFHPSFLLLNILLFHVKHLSFEKQQTLRN